MIIATHIGQIKVLNSNEPIQPTPTKKGKIWKEVLFDDWGFPDTQNEYELLLPNEDKPIVQKRKFPAYDLDTVDTNLTLGMIQHS